MTPPRPARYSRAVRIREVLSALLICASVTSCARGGADPRPAGTLEPSIIESSALPTNSPDNKACKLLTAEERAALPGFSMNERIPVQPQPGTEECLWVHSRRAMARAAIRLVAFNARAWAPMAANQVNRAIRDPNVSPALAKKLEKALSELASQGRGLPPERICEIYLLSQEARGIKRTSDLVSFARIGSMPAAYAISCENGVLVMAGYGEYGMQMSIALQHGVVRLVEDASERAPELFETDGETGTGDEAGTDGETGTGDEEPGVADEEGPTEEPSPDESDTDGEAA